MNLDLSLPMVIKMEIQNWKVKVKRMATSLGWPKKTVIKRPMETKMVTLNCLARERPKDLEMVMPMRRVKEMLKVKGMDFLMKMAKARQTVTNLVKLRNLVKATPTVKAMD